jgi:hypothetical protein
MKKRITILMLALLQVSTMIGQEHGTLSSTLGIAHFYDHGMNGFGMNISYQSPYILKSEKIFIELGGTIFVGEGNRNFKVDYSKLHSLSHPDISTPFADARGTTSDTWIPLGLKTSQSMHGSYELMLAKAFDLGKNKHRLILGAGIYRADISQQYILETIKMEIINIDLQDPNKPEVLYHIPYSQRYTVTDFISNIQYHYQITESVFLRTDIRYYYQNSPFKGSLFISTGVGVVI